MVEGVGQPCPPELSKGLTCQGSIAVEVGIGLGGRETE